MNGQIILKRITSLTFRQVFYLLTGIFLLVTGIISRDWTIGTLSLLFLYQGIFNTCLFGSCAIPKAIQNKADYVNIQQFLELILLKK